jgi:hypothetical protein
MIMAPGNNCGDQATKPLVSCVKVFKKQLMNNPAASSGVSRDKLFLSSQQAAGNSTRSD